MSQNDKFESARNHDPLASVTMVTPVSGQEPGNAQWNGYSAFGQNFVTYPGPNPNRLKYTGREDDGSGLYYYRARYYDPSLGRFISEDPLQFQAGINFYAYVGNNPINSNDPYGLVDWWGLGKSTVNLASNGAGVFVGGTMVVGGAGLIASPDPTLLTKVAGVGGVTFGSAIYTKSVAGVALNAQNFMDALRDQPASQPDSLAGLIAEQVAPGNATVRGISDIADLMLDLAAGRAPISNRLVLENALPSSRLANAAETIASSYTNGEMFNRAADTFQGFAIGGALFNYGNDLRSALSPAVTTPGFTDFGSPSLDFSNFANLGGAAGGFLLYPNKANLNQLRSVYAK